MSKKYNNFVSDGEDFQIAADTSTSDEKTAEPVTTIAIDEYAGKGGSYTLDPATGIRTRNE